MNFLNEDLEEIVSRTLVLWEQVKGKTIFITGGTGFFGSWLVRSFIKANRKLELKSNVIILTRSKVRFHARFSDLIHESNITLIEGDVIDFDFPETEIDYIIHAATDADDKAINDMPLLMLDTIVSGTRRVLNLALSKKVTAMLLVSSGAVYGTQPSHISHLGEDFNGSPNVITSSSYAEGKRMAEFLSLVYCNRYEVPVKIARCFAFVGPFLPLDRHYAIGHFMNQALKGQEIVITSDGTPRRSYMYTTDLAVWLWTVLLAGKLSYPYNVGSEEDYSLEEVAGIVAELSGNDIPVKVLKKQIIGTPIQRYTPATGRAQQDLNLKSFTNLRTAVSKTLSFHKYVREQGSSQI